MRCTNCGKEIEKGAKFCTFCGARIPSAPSASSGYQKSTREPLYCGPIQDPKKKRRWPLLIVFLLFLVVFSGFAVFSVVKLKGASEEWKENVEAMEEEKIFSDNEYSGEKSAEDDESIKDIWWTGSSTTGTTAAAVVPEAFSDTMLNAYEIANRNLIVEYEKEHGYQ